MKENLLLLRDLLETLKSKIFKHMTTVSKNIHFDVLDNFVNEHNNTVHRTIKKKPIEVTSNSYAEYNEDSNKKILSLKLMIVLEFQNTKIFLLKDTLQIGQKKFLLSVNLKIQFRRLMLLVT